MDPAVPIKVWQQHCNFFLAQRLPFGVWRLPAASPVGAYPVQDRLAKRLASLCWRLVETGQDARVGSSELVLVRADTASRAASTS